MNTLPRADSEYTHAACPEKLLLLAIIEQAVYDILYFKDMEEGSSLVAKNSTLYNIHLRYNNAKTAQKWILSSLDTADVPFSFLWCVGYCFGEDSSSAAVALIRKKVGVRIPYKPEYAMFKGGSTAQAVLKIKKV